MVTAKDTGECEIETDYRDLRPLLPDYAGNPAAWGALMEREGVWPEPYFDDGVPVLWRGFFVDERTGETIFTPFTVGQAGTAVSSAVLMKHGIDPTPYIGD